jgi:hypothetical protein
MWSQKSKADVLRQAERVAKWAAALHTSVQDAGASPDEVLLMLRQMRECIEFAEAAASWDATDAP